MEENSLKRDTYMIREQSPGNGRYEIDCKEGAITRSRVMEIERRADYLEKKLDKMTYLIITSLLTAILNLVTNIGGSI